MPGQSNLYFQDANFGTQIIGCYAEVFDKVSSTNDVAIRLGKELKPEGTLVIAEDQTSGRGRRSRTWYSSPESNILATVILRHRLLKSQIGLPCLIGAVAVADAIRECTGLSTKIKWPNDVHIDGKKVAGLLAELEYDHRQQPFLVLGFGVNVDIENFPISLKQTATSLKIESGKTWCRVTLLGAILRGIEKHYFDLKSNQTKNLIEKANQLCAILGQEIKIQTSEETFSGTAERIDEDGGLLLSQESENNRKILIGEVVKTSR